MKKGAILVIEGPDGSGKETQSKLLVQNLREKGIDCEYMTFPQYDTPTGKVVSMYLGRFPYQPQFGNPLSLNPKIASTLYGLDRNAQKNKILSTIASGKHIILDRYTSSNLAHQGGKHIPQYTDNPKEFNSNLEFVQLVAWVEQFEYEELGNPKPDKTFFLDVPIHISTGLKEKMNVALDGHEGNIPHLRGAYAAYHILSRQKQWEIIPCSTQNEGEDVMKSQKEINNLLLEKVMSYLESRKPIIEKEITPQQ